MPDSHSGTPAPSDPGSRPEKKQRTKRPLDEEAIDFDEQAPSDGSNISGLSYHISRSGPLSGSSVMPWSELIKDNDDLGRELFRQETTNDAQLLRDALAQEPPPSPVDDAAEETAHPDMSEHAPVAEEDDDDFHLGPLPDMDDASSIFGRAVGLRSELSEHAWRESAEVDLLGNEPADHDDRTDELRRPSVDSGRNLRPVERSRDEALLGRADVEPSAVDLGSKPAGVIPSSFVRQAQNGSARGQANGVPVGVSDHGRADLLSAPSEVFDLAAAGLAANQFNLALDEKPPQRWKAWVGGGVCGLLVGAATYLALWYSHALPDPPGGATSRPVVAAGLQNAQEKARAAAWVAEREELQARADDATSRAQKAQSDYDTLTAKLKAAKIDTTDLQAVAARLAREESAVEQSRRVSEAYAALSAAVKSANLDPNDVPAAVARLSQARAAAEAAGLQAEASAARLRQEAATAARNAKAAEERLKTELDRHATARAALADFQAEVIARLKAIGAIHNESAPGELLDALDAALHRQPGTLPRPNSAAAVREYGAGRELYRAGDYHAAEQAFDASHKANERDARSLYFRGLCRWQLGRTDDAGRDFAKAADLERQNLPHSGEIDAALERVQGGPRHALNRYRP
jgi:tetratricopeptide (TPR) repeat protein